MVNLTALVSALESYMLVLQLVHKLEEQLVLYLADLLGCWHCTKEQQLEVLLVLLKVSWLALGWDCRFGK